MNRVEEYAKACDLQFRDAMDVVEEFQSEMLQMRGRCMDVGCGPGDVTRKLILANLSDDAEVVGADISKPMIDYAKEKHRDEERMSFIQLDIQGALPNDQIGQYDNVLSFYCLHWCSNTRDAFENIYKLLRPGGLGLVMFIGWNDGFDVYTRMHGYPQYQPYTQDVDRYVPHFHRCKNSRAALKKTLEDVGLEVLHCSKREKSYLYPSKENFTDHMVAVNPFIDRMPEHLKSEFEQDLEFEFLRNKNMVPYRKGENQSELTVLDIYQLLVAYFKKPLDAR